MMGVLCGCACRIKCSIVVSVLAATFGLSHSILLQHRLVTISVCQQYRLALKSKSSPLEWRPHPPRRVTLVHVLACMINSMPRRLHAPSMHQWSYHV